MSVNEVSVVVADVLAREVAGLNGNAHPVRPDVIAPPVAFVDGWELNQDEPTLRQLSLALTVVIVADGVDAAAQRTLNDLSEAVWVAAGHANCTAGPMATALFEPGPGPAPFGQIQPVYRSVRLTLHTITTPTPLVRPPAA